MTSPNAPAPSALSAYDFGRSTSYALQTDPRFSYCLYAPMRFRNKSERSAARLLVVVHGTDRSNQSLRDLFAPLAERHGLIVLAPLFPCGISAPQERDSYKYFADEAPQYDQVLWHMVDEIAHRYGVTFPRLSLFGFSGGAHFTHRFVYVHATRIDAASVCAPGSPTLLDVQYDWWVGTRDFERRFGRPIDLSALRRVRFHLAVGDADTDTSEITHAPGGPYYMPNANVSGRTRIERLHALAESLRSAGVSPVIDVLPGVGHQVEPLAAAASKFLEGVYAPSLPREGASGGAR